MARRRRKAEIADTGSAVGEAVAAPDIPALYRRVVESNRFLPIPKAEQSFVGDGDFRAIGAEFLEHFIRHGGLRPDSDVLDYGCGIGRMALPLTQYLSPGASYVGVDVNRQGLAWCRRRISKVYPNFTFRHVDYSNPLYNPSGKASPWEHPLPFAAGSFDFVIATSVFTHLSRHDFKSLVRQLSSLLRTGGRLFATFFLLDDVSVEAMGRGGARLTFPDAGARMTAGAVGHPPGSAVAFRRDYVESILEGNGFSVGKPLLRGTWSGAGGGLTYQDVIVAERRPSGMGTRESDSPANAATDGR
ncbi:MAG: class I SAM-dependent methyltransferase [Thalassobaculum sp.]|uniref:class I SAM-dependent methyltransferase n=1 Tax=Thalassobaculum sp. TaxID=2022740 RepID=UPI0032EB8810